jgi:hypothetical protein
MQLLLTPTADADSTTAVKEDRPAHLIPGEARAFAKATARAVTRPSEAATTVATRKP